MWSACREETLWSALKEHVRVLHRFSTPPGEGFGVPSPPQQA